MTSPITPQLINHLKPSQGLISAQRAEAYLDEYSPYQLGLYVESLEWLTQFRAPVPTHTTTTPYHVHVDQATVVIQINQTTVIIDPHAQFDIHRYTPDLIIVTHAHQDHCGGLLALCHAHPTCGVAMTAITWDLCAIHASDGITEIREHVGYTLVTDGHPQTINQIELRCYAAGHLIGACMVDLRLDGVSILITGDMCVRSIAHALSAHWPTHAYDLVLVEGTHVGDSALPVTDQTHNNHALVQKCIHSTDEHIVIMATALGAAQDIYTHLITAQMQGHMPRHRIYLHGKAAEVAHYYQRRFMGTSPQWKLPVHELSTTTPARPSIIITSTTNEQHIASLTQRGTLIRPAFDQLLITQSTHYWHTSHASQRELICTALAIPSTHVGFYHTSVSIHEFVELAQFFAACGRSAQLMNHTQWEA
jgi:L-ascorbate metabolism protein UlaG (beta-lactamase superfamily)